MGAVNKRKEWGVEGEETAHECQMHGWCLKKVVAQCIIFLSGTYSD